MWTDTTIVIAGLLILGLERVAIGIVTRRPGGRDWIVRHRLFHPNSISLMRIPMGLASLLMFRMGVPTLGIFWFMIWMVADLTDGTIARNCNLATEMGKWLDPLSDKCMYFPMLLYFAVVPTENRLPLPWVLALIAIDCIGQASRLFLARKAPNYFGRAKTALVGILIAIVGIDFIAELPFVGPFLLLLLTGSCTILAFLSMYCRVIPANWYANSMTLANFICGLASIERVHRHEPVQALILIFAGQLFDLFDGRLARRFGSTRRGPMYDDIADGTSFGVALGYLIYQLLIEAKLSPAVAVAVAVLYTGAVIYRLYRFLHPTREMPPGIFQGMPAPAGAMLGGASALLFSPERPWLAAGLVILTSGLLISNIRYRHFGQHMWPSLPRMAKLLFGVLLLVFVNLAIANRHYANAFRIYCFLMASLYALGGIDYKGSPGEVVEEVLEDEEEDD